MAPQRDLFANFERMRREIDELFGDFFDRPALAPHRRACFTPAVDIAYADEPPRAIVTAALPGVRIEDVELEVQGRELSISGHRRPAAPEGRAYQQIEIEHGPFRRVVQLGADVMTDQTRATYEDGFLRVELPLRAPEQRVQTVPIEATSPGSSETAIGGPPFPGGARRPSRPREGADS